MNEQRKHRISAATAVSAAAMASVLGTSVVGAAEAVAKAPSAPAVRALDKTSSPILIKIIQSDVNAVFFKVNQAFWKIDQIFQKGGQQGP